MKRGAAEFFLVAPDLTIRFCRGDIVLMQFTGLTDSKGREIWEGDVLRGKRGLLYEVAWCQEGACFQTRRWVGSDFTWDTHFNTMIEEDDIDFEVIGNIYENPELLEQSHETKAE